MISPKLIDNNRIQIDNEIHFSTYIQNVRGLGSKHKKFFCSSASYDYDLIILTETWLKDSHFTAEYFDDSFSVYREDRVKRRGGGVLIGLKNNLFGSEQIHIDGTDDLEYVCIKAKIKTQVIFIYCAYIPPNSTQHTYQSHINAINSITTNPNDLLIVTGDFNLPKIQWTSESDDNNIMLPSILNPPFAADFINELMRKGLCQINNLRNKTNRLLDLFFTNDYTNCTVNHAKPLDKIDEFHPPILVEFEWHASTVLDTERVQKVFNFKKADYTGMKNHLASIDFNEMFAEKTLDQKISAFHSTLSSAIERFVPSYDKKINQKCPWANKDWRNLKNKKNKAWKKFKRTGDKAQFDLAFGNFDALNTELYEAYVDKLKSNLADDPSSFWRYVNSKKNTDNQPKTLYLGQIRTSNETEQANLFAEFFKRNYDQPSNTVNQTEPSLSNVQTDPNHEPAQFQLDLQFVLEELASINTKKGAGPDGVHPLLMKKCAAVLAEPLHAIFNESLTSGIFPHDWKRSSVTPIFII